MNFNCEIQMLVLSFIWHQFIVIIMLIELLMVSHFHSG